MNFDKCPKCKEWVWMDHHTCDPDFYVSRDWDGPDDFYSCIEKDVDPSARCAGDEEIAAEKYCEDDQPGMHIYKN